MSDLRNLITELRSDMNRQFAEFRGETDRRFAESREEVRDRFGNVDRQFDNVNRQLLYLNQKLDRQFTWLVGTQLTLFAGVITALVGAYYR